MTDFTVDAQMVADMIVELGSTITLADGTTAKAIVDADYASLRRTVPQTVLDMASGPVALFYFFPADFDRIPRGTPLVRAGVAWTQNTLVRDFSAGDTPLLKGILCTAGGNH